MKEKFEKELRRFLKRRRKVTETVIVCFLINSSVSFSFLSDFKRPEDYEIYTDKNYDRTNLNVWNQVVLKDGISSIDGNSHGIITRSTLQQNQVGNGVLGNIEDNRSTVNGEVDLIATENFELKLSGNGITGEVKNNTGIIKGEAEISVQVGLPYEYHKIIVTSGNGVGGSIENNIGIVVGEFNTDIVVEGVLPNLPPSHLNLSFLGNGVGENVGSNTGVIRGLSNITLTGITNIEYLNSDIYKSGNGIGGNVTSNTGVIQGEINATREGTKTTYIDHSGNGVGMYVKSNKGKITGKGGVILKYPKLYFYGSLGTIGNGVDLSLINNSGIISGNFTFLVTNDSYVSPYLMESGNGIHYGYTQNSEGNLKNEDEKIDIIVKNNTGVIEGEAHIATDISETTSSYNDLYIRGLGNGVHGEINYNNTVENNKGLIKGGIAALGEYTDVFIWYSLEAGSGNGVYGTIKNNFGTVAGSLKVNGTNNLKPEFSGNGLAIKSQEFWGSPDYFKGPIQVKNSGFIGGSESAIAIMDSKVTGSITNYGILAGKEIISNGTAGINYSDYQNYGVEIKINDDDERSVSLVKNAILEGGDGVGRNIINAEVLVSQKDSYITVDKDKEYKDYVINGAGIESGTLTLKDSKAFLDNTIVNGYEKAITLNGSSTLMAVDSIFNGGGLGIWIDNGTPNNNSDDYFQYTPVIEGDSGDNIVNLTGQSIVNGVVELGQGNDTLILSGSSMTNGDLILGSGDDTVEIIDAVTVNKVIMLGEGNDELSISTGVQLNDSIYGEAGRDILSLGDLPYIQGETTTVDYDNSLNIYHTINGFEEINVEGSVTFYETAKIEDGEAIYISKDSTLNLRIDPTETDASGRVTGHAFYDSGATISGYVLYEDDGKSGIENDTSAGTLNLVTNGLGVDGIIGMGNTQFDDKLYIKNRLINKQSRNIR